MADDGKPDLGFLTSRKFRQRLKLFFFLGGCVVWVCFVFKPLIERIVIAIFASYFFIKIYRRNLGVIEGPAEISANSKKTKKEKNTQIKENLVFLGWTLFSFVSAIGLFLWRQNGATERRDGLLRTGIIFFVITIPFLGSRIFNSRLWTTRERISVWISFCISMLFICLALTVSHR